MRPKRHRGSCDASFAVFDTRGLDVWLADNSIGDIVIVLRMALSLLLHICRLWIERSALHL
ncbi:unnamed protein product [Prunus armeniaca]|nr:unnamed protein product [Prunus armeniaca]